MFALCEGPHDVAFLYRILQVNGLQKYSKPIGEFPAPLNKYFASEAAGENLEQLKLEEVRNRRLPSEVLAHKDDALVLLYAIGGDSQVEPRQKLLQDVARIYGRHQPEEKKSKRERQPNARSSIFSMRIRKGPMLGYRRFVVSCPRYWNRRFPYQEIRSNTGIPTASLMPPISLPKQGNRPANWKISSFR